MSGNNLINGKDSNNKPQELDFPTQINESVRQDHTGVEELEEMSVDKISFLKATSHIISNSIPSTLGLSCESLVYAINLVFIGHLEDRVALAGVGLGNMMIIITCFSVGIGLNGAIDTLVSQAYGNKQYYL